MGTKRHYLKREQLVTLIRWMDSQEQGGMSREEARMKAIKELGFQVERSAFARTAHQVGMKFKHSNPNVLGHETRQRRMGIVIAAVHDLYVKLGEKEGEAFSALYETMVQNRADEV